VKLLLDEMLPAVIAHQLRSRGHDVVAVAEHPELRGLADPDLFAHAQKQVRAIVTYNRDDFLALDRSCRAQGRAHHGIVILNPNRFPQGPPTTGPLIAALDALATTDPPYPSFIHWLHADRLGIVGTVISERMQRQLGVARNEEAPRDLRAPSG